MDFLSIVIARANYWTYIILMMVGLYAMIAKNNLVKKIVGMSIFQTAVILFYVSIGAKQGATIPILLHGHAPQVGGGNLAHAAVSHGAAAVHAVDYINPLPHVLMLTAIVVGVATLGVALALAVKVYKEYGTLEEDEINQRLRS
ncbi:MAG: cation:proton antiporter subunit C [Desulfobacteraceae bacterium]|nr:cation:proton antiporter subunit C [Desulfobacteraceae bacterium]